MRILYASSSKVTKISLKRSSVQKTPGQSLQKHLSVSLTSRESGHKFIGHVPIISNVIFNIFSKNYVAEQNSLIHKSRKRAKESETVEDEKKIKRDPCEMKKNKLRSEK